MRASVQRSSTLAITYKDLWLLGRYCLSFSKKARVLSLNLPPPHGFSLARHKPINGSDSSMMALVMAKCCAEVHLVIEVSKLQQLSCLDLAYPQVSLSRLLLLCDQHMAFSLVVILSEG